MTVSVFSFFLTVPWAGLQCVIVVFPDYIHLPFYGGILYYKPIKEHLLKSNFGSDNCLAIWSLFGSDELANFTNSVTEAEIIYMYWT